MLRTAGPRANGILSIRSDRPTRPDASDARLTRPYQVVPCTNITDTRRLTVSLSPGSPVRAGTKQYTGALQALYNAPHRSAPLESCDRPFCYEGFNDPGAPTACWLRLWPSPSSGLLDLAPSPRSLTCQKSCVDSHIYDSFCIQPIGPGPCQVRLHTPQDAGL